MSILESICREMDFGRRAALVSVVEQSASSPRHAGAAMLVGPDGIVAGTIGGGAMEAKAIEAGKRVLEGDAVEFVDFDLTNSDAAKSDMICGGRMRFFVEPLKPDSPTSVLFKRLRIASAMGDAMFCVVPEKAPHARRLCRMDAGEWPLPAELRDRIREKKEKGELLSPCVITTSDKLTFVIEPWIAPFRLVLAGGGHVSLATAKVAASTDFMISVIDDREEFSNSLRFPMAALTRVSPEYEDCFRDFHFDGNTFVAIMTRGHLFDAKVLRQALQTKAGYIGMIGSRRKIAMVYDKLRKEGVSDEELARVTAPIGLPIGAETPEEIAVSITAQLIEVRARKEGSTRHLDAFRSGI